MWRKRLEMNQWLGLTVLGLAAVAGCGGNTGTNGNNVGASGMQPQAGTTAQKAGVVPNTPAKQVAETESNANVSAASESRVDPFASDPSSKLHERIIGKWMQKIGDDNGPIVADLTYEFTRDKQIITTVLHNTKPGLPPPPTIPRKEHSYRVLNDKEIEVETPGHKVRFTVEIKNGELNMGGHKDRDGKLSVFKKVK